MTSRAFRTISTRAARATKGEPVLCGDAANRATFFSCGGNAVSVTLLENSERWFFTHEHVKFVHRYAVGDRVRVNSNCESEHWVGLEFEIMRQPHHTHDPLDMGRDLYTCKGPKDFTKAYPTAAFMEADLDPVIGYAGWHNPPQLPPKFKKGDKVNVKYLQHVGGRIAGTVSGVMPGPCGGYDYTVCVGPPRDSSKMTLSEGQLEPATKQEFTSTDVKPKFKLGDKVRVRMDLPYVWDIATILGSTTGCDTSTSYSVVMDGQPDPCSGAGLRFENIAAWDVRTFEAK